MAVTCGVADEAQAKAIVDRTVSTFGRLDMAYNAGILGPMCPMSEQTADGFDEVNAINLRGLWTCMKHEPVAGAFRHRNAGPFARGLRSCLRRGCFSLHPTTRHGGRHTGQCLEAGKHIGLQCTDRELGEAILGILNQPNVPTDHAAKIDPFIARILPYIDLEAMQADMPSQLGQFYADMHGWQHLADQVAGIARALPQADRAKLRVFAADYGQAAAIDSLARTAFSPARSAATTSIGSGVLAISTEQSQLMSAASWRTTAKSGRY